MMLSGAELIRTSDRIAHAKLRLVDSATPLKAEESSPDRQDDHGGSKDALMRFARFIREDQQKKKGAPKQDKAPPSQLPVAYQRQLQLNATESGNLLDIIA